MLFKLGPHEIHEGDKATDRFVVLNFKHFLTPDMALSLFGFVKDNDEWLTKVLLSC